MHPKLKFFLLTLTIGSGCIRSVEDLPDALEGTTITGQATAKNLLSGDFVGVVDLSVNARGTSVHATSDERGFFRLDQLPLGTYDILLERRGTPPLARLLNGVRLQVDGQALDLGEIRLGAPGTIEGRVLLEGDTPFTAPGVLVSLVGTGLRGFTDAEGVYRIAGVPEGEYELAAVRPDFVPGNLSGIRAVATARTLAADLLLESSSIPIQTTVQGSARRFDDAPGVIEVRFSPSKGETVETQTDANGGFELTLNTGLYVARFEAENYQPVEIAGVVVLREGPVGLRPVVLVPAPSANDGDLDNDGVPDDLDAAPNDPTRGADLDGDGDADEVDVDIDGDGIDNDQELSLGEDGWITDPRNPDTDDDGPRDNEDNCPTVANPDQLDANMDEVGDICESLIAPPCDLAAPRLLSVTPNPIQPGAELLVVAAPLVAPSCAPTGVAFAELAFADGAGVSRTATAIESTLRGLVVDGQIAQEARYVVPTDLAPGSYGITVVPLYASASNSIAVEVAPPSLTVTDVLPFAGPPGSRITVVGEGFDDPQGGPLVVGFPSSADITVAAATDRFEVDVPATAPEGVAQVSLRNDRASTTFSFTVSTTIPVVTGVSRTMVEPGVDALELYGSNLDRVTAVQFGGGVTAPPTSAVFDTLIIDPVPAGVRPGAVTLQRPGEADVEALSELSVITQTRQRALGGVNHAALSFDAVAGTRIVAFGSNTIRDFRYSDLQPIGPVRAFPGAAVGIAPRPAHDRAVVTVTDPTVGRQTYVVQLSDGQILGSCSPAFAPINNVDPDDYTFTPDGRYAFVLETRVTGQDQELLRVDMDPQATADPTCVRAPVGQPCGNTIFSNNAVAPKSANEVFVYFDTGPASDLGMSLLTLDTTLPASVTCTEPPVRNYPDAFFSRQTLWDRAEGIIWVATNTNLLFGLSDDLSRGQVLHRLLDVERAGEGLRTVPGSRWITTGAAVIDRRSKVVAWQARSSLSYGVVDLHPNGREILRLQGATASVLEIETAP